MKRIPAALSAVLILAATLREGYLWAEDRQTLAEDRGMLAEDRAAWVEDRQMLAEDRPMWTEMIGKQLTRGVRQPTFPNLQLKILVLQAT